MNILKKVFNLSTVLKNVYFAMLLYMISSGPLFAQTVDTLWAEDWESDWSSDWHITYGTWEIGAPTSGPGSAHSLQNCAATILAGNYADYVDSTRLIRHKSFVVPPKDENPRLRFWHWYSFRINDNDYGKVQIKVDGSSDWVDLPEAVFRDRSGGIWTRAFIDLSAYAGQSVQIAFRFHSDDYYTSPGWYIDDVSVEKGPLILSAFEDWESGFDSWYVDYGTWDVGVPASGPDSAFNGHNCIATGLTGAYYDYVDSTRIISPIVTIPNSAEYPRLRFWHWYSFRINDSDYGKVQIKVDGSNNWVDLPEAVFRDRSGGIWTRAHIDLSGYAGQSVQFAFYFHSDDYYTASGWYIDDIMIETGQLKFVNPENWEDGINDWYVDYGTWEIGIPTSGPDGAYQGQFCAGTKLDGNYYDYVDSTRLISPHIQVPSIDKDPVLRFFHWYSFRINDNDYGEVQIRIVGAGNKWQTIEKYDDASTVWYEPYLPLTNYAGSTVQIAFYFHSDDYYTSSGWYIDSVRVEPIDPSRIDEPLSVSPNKFILFQNYPNPFNPVTKIRFGLPKASVVRINVYNTLGQKVADILNANKPAGMHEIYFDGAHLASGVYYYKIEAGDFVQVKKMLLVK